MSKTYTLQCQECGRTYGSPDPKSLFCSEECRIEDSYRPVGLRAMLMSDEAAAELERILADDTIPRYEGKPMPMMTTEEFLELGKQQGKGT